MVLAAIETGACGKAVRWCMQPAGRVVKLRPSMRLWIVAHAFRASAVAPMQQPGTATAERGTGHTRSRWLCPLFRSL